MNFFDLKEDVMDQYRTVVIAWILVSLLSFPAGAQGIPGRWEKVEALRPGSPITVGLKTGDRLRGRFEGLSPSKLLLRTNSAQATIPRADVKTIALRSKDGLGDGALTGAVTGAGFMGLAVIGLTLLIREASSTGIAAAALALGGLGAGIGAGIGVAVDAATKPDDIVLYKAPERPVNAKQRDWERSTSRSVAERAVETPALATKGKGLQGDGHE